MRYRLALGMRRVVWSLCAALYISGCGTSDDIQLEDLPEEVRYPCRVIEDEANGSAVIQCSDGSSAVIRSGRDGRDGAGCTAEQGSAGEHTIRCADGTSAVVRDGEGGASCGLEERAGQTFLVCDGGQEINLSQGGQGMVPGSCTTLMGHAVIWNELDVAELAAAGCTAVEGDLRIEAGALGSLAGLSKLTRVGGDLIIRGNSALTTLAGLEGLVEVGRRVVIEENAALTSLEALGGIGGADGHTLRALIVRKNYNINSLVGLEWVRGASDALILESLEVNSLAPLSGLAGDVAHVRLAETSGIEGLEGLAGIRAVRVLELEGNQGLKDMDGLKVTQISERLVVRDNAELASIGGLEQLEQDLAANPPQPRALGDVMIAGNERLVNLTGLDGVRRMGTLEVRGNAALTGWWTDYQGVSELERLVVEGNGALVALTGLYTLTSAPSVEILDNDALTTISMDGLSQVEELRIEGNGALTGQSSSFLSLYRIERLIIEGNGALSSLNLLSSSATIYALLRVVNNPMLPPCAAAPLAAGGSGDPDAGPPARVEIWQNGSTFMMCP
jgi:hypothetical protein